MSNFFSSPRFLAASADTLLHGRGAVPRTIRVDGWMFDALVLPDGSVAGNSMSDFLERRSPQSPPLGEVLEVGSLPRVALGRVAVTHPPSTVPGRVPAPTIDWSGFSSWETFVAQTSKRDWRAFKITKRKRRLLTRNFGPVNIDLDVLDHDLVEQALIHKARQLRQTRGLDRFVGRRTRQLVHRLVQERQLTLSVLSAGGRPLAFALAHWGPDRVYSWITSYDLDAANCSTGTQLYEAMMHESWSRDHAEFDFLIGGEPYKYHYATHERLIGPLGQPSLPSRVLGKIRRGSDGDEAPSPVQLATRVLALRAVQIRLSRQTPAPIDDDAYRGPIEAYAPQWPRLRFSTPHDCQRAQVLARAHANDGAVATALIRAEHLLRGAGDYAKAGSGRLAALRADGTEVAEPAQPLNLKAGAWVRVKTAEEIPSHKAPWAGRTLRVKRRVGPHYDLRTQRVVAYRGAVTLEGMRCDGSPAAQGCDARCEAIWRQAWLERLEEDEAAAQPTDATPSSTETSQPLMRVRSQADIEREQQANPDPAGVRFSPATMAQFCGRVLRVEARVARVYDPRRDRSIPVQDVVLLGDASCPGATIVAAGRCDRRCALLWKTAWLEPVER